MAALGESLSGSRPPAFGPNSDLEKWCEQLTSNKATECAQHRPSTCCAPWLLMHDSYSLSADPCHPQTSRAVSTTNLIFAACVSTAIALPSTVLENPHCGDKHNCSSGTYCAASSIRRLSSSLDSSAPTFVLTSPSTTVLPLGTNLSGAKPPERA